MPRQEAIFENLNHSKDITLEVENVPKGFDVQIHLPLLVLAVLIVLLNGTVIGLFVRKRSLRSFTNYFLVSLAISDLLTGLLSIPFYVSCDATERKDLCNASNQFFVFTSLSTILHIVAITSDRYIAILKSLRYLDLVSKKRVQLVTAAIWLCCSFLTLIQLTWTATSEEGPNDISTEDYQKKELVYTIIMMVLGITPIPFMVFAYCCIFVQIHRQNSLTREHNRLVGGWGEKRSTHELKTVCMFVLILFAYTFCSLPNAAFRLEMNIDDTLDDIPEFVFHIIMYLFFFTSFLNPCFYGFGKHDFRSAINDLFKTFRRQRNNSDNSNVSLIRTTGV